MASRREVYSNHSSYGNVHFLRDCNVSVRKLAGKTTKLASAVSISTTMRESAGERGERERLHDDNTLTMVVCRD